MRERRGGGPGKATFLGWVALSLPGLPAPARLAHDDPPVERTQKNIRVLHGLPTSQLIPVMAVMANSLGVTCAHCHTSEWESDDKPPKEAARRMIRMTLDANRVFYEAKTVITCNTCHRGATEPVGILASRTPVGIEAGPRLRSRTACPRWETFSIATSRISGDGNGSGGSARGDSPVSCRGTVEGPAPPEIS